METFKVVAVRDGNTIEVSPEWEFKNETGVYVQAKGYNAPKTGKAAMAFEQRLSTLLLNREIELKSPEGVQRNRLVCEVYYNGTNLSDYFAEYREQLIEEEEAQEGETDINSDVEIDTEEREDAEAG